MKLKTFTIEDIMSWQPCHDPSRHLPEDWSGNALDILRMENIPADDRLWVVLREEVLDAKTLRLIAVWCARSVEHLLTDERSKKAIDVAERYVHGLATDEELAVAAAKARVVARTAVAAAARAAVAAEAAAVDADADAAEVAAATRAAARAAVAARAEVAAATRAAARAAVAARAEAAAEAAAAAEARDAQVQQLIKMLEAA